MDVTNAIEAEGLVKIFGGVRAVDGIDLAVPAGSIFGVLGTVLSGVLLGDGALGQLGQQIFSQGSQLLTLSFSRAQETEADNLGIQYLRGAGYDPRAMSTVLASLAGQTALDARCGATANMPPPTPDLAGSPTR